MDDLTAHILAPLQVQYLETASLREQATLHWRCGLVGVQTTTHEEAAGISTWNWSAVQASGYAPLRFLHELVR